MNSWLRLTELFYSIQGESSRMGLPTVFIRLTGCPLRCVYCDTEYAFKGGVKVSIDDVMTQVEPYQAKYITVTGGEPLAQPGCIPLIDRLCNKGYEVSVETSGAFDIAGIHPKALIVMDLKTPSSGEVSKNLLSNLKYLKADDEIKFVIADREDYVWAKNFIVKSDLSQKHHVLMSPSYEVLSVKNLAEWILADRLNVRLQTQLHKFIWPDEEKGR